MRLNYCGHEVGEKQWLENLQELEVQGKAIALGGSRSQANSTDGMERTFS